MNITPGMRAKAHRIIAADCHASWRAANVKPDGFRYKRHRPYSVPDRAEALIQALDADDGLELKRLFVWADSPDSSLI